MNYYSLIPLVSFLIHLFNWTYIYAQRRKNPVNRAYLFFVALLAGFSIESFIVWSPIEKAWLLPILKIGSALYLMIGFCFLNFIYTFVERKRDCIYYTFLTFYIISMTLSLSTQLFIRGYIDNYWGASEIVGLLYVPIIIISMVFPFLYASFLLYNESKSTKDNNKKNQSVLVLQGAFTTFFIMIISNIILPQFFHMNIIRIGSSATIVWSIFLFKAIKKYNFLSIGIEEASHDLFTNIRDGVVLVDKNESIIQMNEYGKELFHLRHADTKDLKISDLFEHYNFAEDYKNYETNIPINGDQRIVSLSQATVKQDNVELGKILIVRDITENKKAEKELQDNKAKLEALAGELAQANVSLEQKVAERTRSLQKSNEQLQREIVERRRAEEALAAETEQLTVTLRSIGDGVITTDTAGRIVLLNAVAEALTGWPQREAVGQALATVFAIMDEKTRGPCRSPVEEALSTDSIVSRTHHTILISRDRTERIIAESAAPIRDRNSQVIGVVLVFRDMTEKRKMEEELMRADKFESIGVLAGGIAHDFNNILTAIIGNISLAKMYVDHEDKVFTRLVNAEKASLQAQNLTQQLLSFSKGGTLIRRPASIIELIKDSIDFSLRGSNVKCKLSIQEDLWPVEVDEGQMSQVVNNLIINADQSMPEGGLIEVQIENRTIDEKNNIEHTLPLEKGEYIRIAIKDQGVGIPEEHRQKIFDPYFTTKQKGNGLGLFTSYAIIKKHDGHLAVESEVGVGTTFHIFLPVSKKEIVETKEVKKVSIIGKGRILIMEDEENIRDVTGMMLSHFGYSVEFAHDGEEAIHVYKKAKELGQPFDAIIMDLTIPGGMGGKETIKKVLEIDPQARAIVASGYSTDPIMVDFRRHGFSGRIVKPYKSEELHEILHHVITGAHG